MGLWRGIGREDQGGGCEGECVCGSEEGVGRGAVGVIRRFAEGPRGELELGEGRKRAPRGGAELLMVGIAARLEMRTRAP